jgi:hypothetical protein
MMETMNIIRVGYILSTNGNVTMKLPCTANIL